jgi:hypothetical protein
MAYFHAVMKWLTCPCALPKAFRIVTFRDLIASTPTRSLYTYNFAAPKRYIAVTAQIQTTTSLNIFISASVPPK